MNAGRTIGVIGCMLLATALAVGQERGREPQASAPQVSPQRPEPLGRDGQRGRDPQGRFGRRPPWFSPGRGPGDPGGRRHWTGRHLPPFLFELAEKPPEEQERILQANPKFRNLPTEEQERVRRHLKRLSAMTPEERQRFRERFEIFHGLPPEARDKIRNELFPAWNRLPAERRPALLAEFRVLRRLTKQEREQRFAREEFSRQFNPEEQQLLRQLISLSSQ